MKDQRQLYFSGKDCASSYDEQRAKMGPMKDALHFLMRMVLAELPADARILCVGVGTGSELIELAQSFPQWQFTAVEPAVPMLDICRQRTQASGISSRCTYHEGYLDSLPDSAPFDAATSILVSHFILQAEERRNYFRQIAARLRPDGYFISADLATDMSNATYKSLFDVWAQTLKYSDMPAELVEKMISSLGQDVAVLPPQKVESIIASSGFDTPILFFQTLLIHAWYSKRV